MIRETSLLFVAVLAVAPVVAAPKAPVPWLAPLTSLPTPSLPGDVPAYTLLDESLVTITPDGSATTRSRRALRVLTQKGDHLAWASAPYLEKVDKVVSGTAWLVREGKVFKTEPLSSWVDVCAISDGTVFTERRVRTVGFPGEVLTRDVFGYETIVTSPLLVPQLQFEFSDGDPVAQERVELVLPKGWMLDYLARGAGLPPPVVDATRNSWTWELRNLPHVPREEWTPRVLPDAPRLFVTLRPSAEAKNVRLPRMDSWGEVGTWVDQIAAGQCDTNASLAEVAQRLAGESADPVARLRAFCTHVQRIRYVSVDRGLGLGFGYKPRKATEVLARSYGDCKDKANLLRALLREIGVNAHLVAIESGRRHPTIDEWPSVYQFNHVISAIEVDATVELPSVITHADGRRLLLFDPTDEQTVLGDLPYYLQGASGLLLQGGQSSLVRVPELPAEEEWSYATTARLHIAANGIAAGQASFVARRQAGAMGRALLRRLSPKERTEMAARYMSTMLRGVVVQNPTFDDDLVSGDATFAFELAAPGVFQPGPGGIYMMRLDVFSRDNVPQLGAKPRVQPLELRPIADTEVVNFILPDGFAVEDAPKDARVESPFGTYQRTVQVDGATIVLRRELRLRAQIVPAEQCPEVRSFLAAAARADKVAVVLRRAQ